MNLDINNVNYPSETKNTVNSIVVEIRRSSNFYYDYLKLPSYSFNCSAIIKNPFAKCNGDF